MEVHEIWREALRLRESGDENTAREALEQACRLDRRADPDYVVETANPTLWLERGMIFLRQNEFLSSRDCLLRATEGDSDLFEAWLNLGIVHLRMDEPESALSYLSRAQELDSDSAKVHQWTSNALNLLGRHSEARSSANRCLELSPQSVFAMVMRAQAEEKLELYEEAAADYRQALEFTPGNQQVSALLARTLQKAIVLPSLPERTVEQCLEFLQLLPDGDSREVHARIYGGRAYSALGRWDEAEEWLGRAISLGLDEARLELAEMRYKNGSLEDALVVLRGSQQGQFWGRVLGQLDPAEISGDRGDLSDGELAELLSSEVVSLPEKPGWLRLRQELGGGRCRTALLSTDNGPRLEALLTQCYRAPLWPSEADPLNQDLDFEGSLLEECVDWSRVHLRPGDPQAPTLPPAEESWSKVFDALQNADPQTYALVKSDPPSRQLDPGQEAKRGEKLSGDALESTVAYWLARGGPAFTLDVLLNLQRSYAWRQFRRYLAGLDQEAYQEATRAAEKLREKPLLDQERYFLTFCLPKDEWVREDWAHWLAHGQHPQGWCLLSALPDPDMVSQALARRLDSQLPGYYFQDLAVRHGARSARALLLLLDAAPSATHAAQIARALSLLDCAPVRALFQANSDHPRWGEVARDYLERLDLKPLQKKAAPPELVDPALQRALQQATTGGEESPTRVLHLEVAELTLAGARVKSVTSLEGIELCPELETLAALSCSPLSLAPLARLDQLQRLYFGPPPEESEQNPLLWNLVSVEALEDLPQLVELGLPIAPTLHPDYAILARKIAIRGKTLDSSDSRTVDYRVVNEESLNKALAQLNLAMGESLSPLFSTYGLSPQNIESVFVSLTAASVYFSNPIQVFKVKELVQLPQELLDALDALQEEIEDGLDWERDVWESCEQWIGMDYGEAFSSFVSENLGAIINYFLDRLEGQPLMPAETNWFARQVAFEKALAALALPGEPVVDVEHGCLTWVEDGTPRGGCRATLLGTLNLEGEFLAGWCDPVAGHVIGPSLGVPAKAYLNLEQALEVARALAAGTGAEVVQAHQNPGGFLFLGLEGLYRIAEDACPNIHLASVNDSELYSVLLAVHELLTQVRASKALPQARETLGNLMVEIRRRNGLYWHGTRAETFYQTLANRLEATLDMSHDNLWREVRDCLDQWRIQMEQWKPEPLRY